MPINSVVGFVRLTNNTTTAHWTEWRAINRDFNDYALKTQLPSVSDVAVTQSSASVATTSNLVCKRYGNVVTLSGYITAVNIPATTYTDVATVATGSRPSDIVALPVYAGTSALIGSQAHVRNTGIIRVYLATARTSGNIYIGGSWIVS